MTGVTRTFDGSAAGGGYFSCTAPGAEQGDLVLGPPVAASDGRVDAGVVGTVAVSSAGGGDL